MSLLPGPVTATDYHAAGEAFRIVRSGVAVIDGFG